MLRATDTPLNRALVSVTDRSTDATNPMRLIVRNQFDMDSNTGSVNRKNDTGRPKIGSDGEGMGTLLMNRVKMFQSALNERPNKTPIRMAAGKTIRFRVSLVGIAIASWPNWMNGRRACPAGGITPRNSNQRIAAGPIAKAQKTSALP